MTPQEIEHYIQTTPILKAFFTSEALRVEEIGDGNLNFVFRISDATGMSMIIKHAPPYLRLLGRDFALPQERIRVEMHTLSYFKTIAPLSIPTLYFCDEAHFCMALEDLKEYTLLQQNLSASLLIYAKLGDFLATLYTHKPQSYPEDYFENQTMKTISENYIFRFPHIQNHPALTQVAYFTPSPKSALFKENIHSLTHRFLNAKEHLIHGDLHTGSLMISHDELKIIDAEFSFFGPIGFDIGTLLAHILFDEIYALFVQKPLRYASIITTLFEAFEKTAGILPQNVLQESIGFCGAELFRRLVVPAKAKPLEAITSLEDKAKAYAMCEKLSIQLIETFLHVKNLDAFLAIVESHLCPKMH